MTALTTSQKERLDKVVKELWERGYIAREMEAATSYSNSVIGRSMGRLGLKGHHNRYNKYREMPIKAYPVKLWGEPIREYIENGSKVSVYHYAYTDGYRGARL